MTFHEIVGAGRFGALFLLALDLCGIALYDRIIVECERSPPEEISAGCVQHLKVM